MDGLLQLIVLIVCATGWYHVARRAYCEGDGRTPQSIPNTGSQATPLSPPARERVQGDAYEIEYADAEGVVTTRVTEVELVERSAHRTDGKGLVDAFCYLANDRRSFRTDRILKLTDHRTGAVIVDPVVHFEAYYDPPDEISFSHRAVLYKAVSGLKVLIWIAQAEGRIDDPTLDFLCDYIEARRLDEGGTRVADLVWDRAVARRGIIRARPTLDVVSGAIHRLPAGGMVYKQLREFAARLATTSPNRDLRARRLFTFESRDRE